MLVSMTGMLMRRSRVVLGFVVLTPRVVMRCLKVMVGRGEVVRGGLVMMLVCRMLLSHLSALPVEADEETVSENRRSRYVQYGPCR